MRTIPFKEVLWSIAYKLGLDPAVEFLTDEGESLCSYINAWVRRSWDVQDFPEWTSIQEFAVADNHMIPWRAFPVGAPEPVELSRPLKGLPGGSAVCRLTRSMRGFVSGMKGCTWDSITVRRCGLNTCRWRRSLLR